MKHKATSTSTNVHMSEGHEVVMSFHDHSDNLLPFYTIKLDTGDHTLNVFFMPTDGPNFAEVLQHIIGVATEQLEKLSGTAWDNTINELSTKVDQ